MDRTDGRNARIEYRWGLGDTANIRKYAAELVALAPDVSPMLLAFADEVIERSWLTTSTGAHEKRATSANGPGSNPSPPGGVCYI